MSRFEFRTIRIELGLSQEQLAQRLGLKYKQNVCKIENHTGPSGPVAAHMRTLRDLHRQRLKGKNARESLAA